MKRLDNHTSRIILALIGLILLSLNGSLGIIQYCCLFALVPLAFYNGKVGIKGLKYGFYIFYPAHLIIINGIAILLSTIK